MMSDSPPAGGLKKASIARAQEGINSMANINDNVPHLIPIRYNDYHQLIYMTFSYVFGIPKPCCRRFSLVSFRFNDTHFSNSVCFRQNITIFDYLLGIYIYIYMLHIYTYIYIYIYVRFGTKY